MDVKEIEAKFKVIEKANPRLKLNTSSDTISCDTAFVAMDIWGKQMSIEFCQDVLNNIEVNGVRIADYKKINVEELFSIFIQNLTK